MGKVPVGMLGKLICGSSRDSLAKSYAIGGCCILSVPRLSMMMLLCEGTIVYLINNPVSKRAPFMMLTNYKDLTGWTSYQ